MLAFSDIALRLIGVFYAIVSFLGIRRVALGLMITNALIGIRGPGTPHQRKEAAAERLRAAIMLALLVLGGIAGTALALLLDVAALLMIAVNLLSIVYLAIVAPCWIDPYDPPEPAGRSSTIVATAVYLAATLWACAHWAVGRMVPLADAHPGLVTILCAVAGLFVAEAVRRWRSVSDLPQALSPAAEDDGAAEAEWQQACAALAGAPLLLWPSAYRTAIRNGLTGQPLEGWPLPVPELKGYDTMELYEWERAFTEALDPDDPTRTRFRSAVEGEAMLARGQVLLAELQKHLGDRIALPAAPFAQTIEESPARVRLRAVGEEYPLIDPDREWPNQNVWTAAFGLSVGLENDLSAWGEKYDNSGDTEGIPPQSPGATAAAFDREGRALAIRLARELAATARGYIEVSFETRSGTVERISAPGGSKPGAG